MLKMYKHLANIYQIFHFHNNEAFGEGDPFRQNNEFYTMVGRLSMPQVGLSALLVYKIEFLVGLLMA